MRWMAPHGDWIVVSRNSVNNCITGKSIRKRELIRVRK
jgi:hypothetical protein